MKEIFIGLLVLSSFFFFLYFLYIRKIKFLTNLLPEIYFFKKKKEFIKFLKENYEEALIIGLSFKNLYLIFHLDKFKLKLKVDENTLLLILNKYVIMFKRTIINDIIIKNKEKILFSYYIISDYNFIPSIPIRDFNSITMENKQYIYFYHLNPNTGLPDIEMICNKKEKKCIRIKNLFENIKDSVLNKYFNDLKFFVYKEGKIFYLQDFNSLEANL